MYRRMSTVLKEWKRSKNRKPFLLIGNPRTGKTTVINDFIKTEDPDGTHSIKIDFKEEKDKGRIKMWNDLFNRKQDADNLFIRMKELEHIDDISSEEIPLIVFDHVEECRDILNILSAFTLSENRYYVIAAGNISKIPVAIKRYVESQRLYPISYEEFLFIHDEMVSRLYSSMGLRKSGFHENYSAEFREYLVTGGMPECVQTLLDTNDSNKVLEKQKALLDKYRVIITQNEHVAFGKRKEAIFNSFPAQFSKGNTKFMYSKVRGEDKETGREVAGKYESRYLIGPMKKLIEDGIIIPAKDERNEEFLSAFLFDTGLLTAMLGIDSKTVLGKKHYDYEKALLQNYLVQQLCTSFDFTYENTQHGRKDYLTLKENSAESYAYEIDIRKDIEKEPKRIQSRKDRWIIFTYNAYDNDEPNRIRYIPFYMAPKLLDKDFREKIL